MPARACPCDTGKAYAACCGRWHAGDAAPDALTLMRSRYSAYVLGDEDYLLASWHPDTRPAPGTLELNDGTRWLQLKILGHGEETPERAWVEFSAAFKQGGASAQRLHEHSLFLKQNGRWFYHSGRFS